VEAGSNSGGINGKNNGHIASASTIVIVGLTDTKMQDVEESGLRGIDTHVRRLVVNMTQ
jgi:hypothetical protein